MNFVVIIAGIATYACALGCGMAASFTTFGMVDEVNEKLPPEQQFSHFWWDVEKSQRLSRAYRTLCPNGKLRRRRLILTFCFYGSLLLLILVFFLATRFS